MIKTLAVVLLANLLVCISAGATTLNDGPFYGVPYDPNDSVLQLKTVVNAGTTTLTITFTPADSGPTYVLNCIDGDCNGSGRHIVILSPKLFVDSVWEMYMSE